MTNREAKKLMTRQERKDYKAAQREGLPKFYVFITRETPKNHLNIYTKLVSVSKAIDVIYGKVDPMTGLRKPTAKHKFKVV